MPDIDDVLKDFGYHVFVPQNDPILLIEVRFHPALPFELTGGKNTGVVEHFVDAHVADTFGSPLEYLDNNRRSFRVDQKMVLVLRVFTITIRCIVSDIIPALHLRLKGCCDLARDVLRIKIIDDVRQGSGQMPFARYRRSVKGVIDGDKTQIEERTDLFNELRGFNIVSAETG